MTIFQSAVDFLGDVSALTSIVGSRIFGLFIPHPEAAAASGAVTLSLTDDLPTQLLDGVGSASTAVLEVDCWAGSLVTAESIATAVKNALVGYVGTFGDHQVTNVAKVRESHLYEDDTGLNRVSLQFEILYGDP